MEHARPPRRVPGLRSKKVRCVSRKNEGQIELHETVRALLHHPQDLFKPGSQGHRRHEKRCSNSLQGRKRGHATGRLGRGNTTYIIGPENDTLGKAISKKKFAKSFVHYYIPLKMFENQSIEITPEMKDDIEELY